MTELMPSLCNDCVARNQCGKDDVKMCISYTKEIKIKCDDCKFVEDCVDYGWEGCRKFTPAPSKPMTNEEWFVNLPTEEKAKFMCNIYEMGKNGKEYFMRLDKAVEWLKEIHE